MEFADLNQPILDEFGAEFTVPRFNKTIRGILTDGSRRISDNPGNSCAIWTAVSEFPEDPETGDVIEISSAEFQILEIKRPISGSYLIVLSRA